MQTAQGKLPVPRLGKSAELAGRHCQLLSGHAATGRPGAQERIKQLLAVFQYHHIIQRDLATGRPGAQELIKRLLVVSQYHHIVQRDLATADEDRNNPGPPQ